MKRLKLLPLMLLLFPALVSGQNLVPNGDFEQYLNCPVTYNQISSASFWTNPHLNPPLGTPDYFNSCALSAGVGVPVNGSGNYQLAHSGGGYAGIITWGHNENREYIQTNLTSPLIAHARYHFEMYVNLANLSAYATDKIGAYFSDSALFNISSYVLPFHPQVSYTAFITDTANWVFISKDFTASGGENYLVIGNFSDNANTNLLYLGSPGRNPYYYIDDVSVTLCTTDLEEVDLNQSVLVYSNPELDILQVRAQNVGHYTISICDISGRQVEQHSFTDYLESSTAGLPRGIYVYQILNETKQAKTGKFVLE